MVRASRTMRTGLVSGRSAVLRSRACEASCRAPASVDCASTEWPAKAKRATAVSHPTTSRTLFMMSLLLASLRSESVCASKSFIVEDTTRRLGMATAVPPPFGAKKAEGRRGAGVGVVKPRRHVKEKSDSAVERGGIKHGGGGGRRIKDFKDYLLDARR